jgi:hypothetical protein
MSNYYPDTVVREADIATEARPRTGLRMSLMLLVVGLLAAGLIGFHAFKATILKQVTAKIQSTQPAVATVKAALQLWQASTPAVGSLRASNGADIAPAIIYQYPASTRNGWFSVASDPTARLLADRHVRKPVGVTRLKQQLYSSVRASCAGDKRT